MIGGTVVEHAMRVQHAGVLIAMHVPRSCSRRMSQRMPRVQENDAGACAPTSAQPRTPQPAGARPHARMRACVRSYRAIMENPDAINWALLPRALLGLVALLCGNGYIVGINQIYDVDIDVVNKPFLPVASGGALCRQGAV